MTDTLNGIANAAAFTNELRHWQSSLIISETMANQLDCVPAVFSAIVRQGHILRLEAASKH
jgi:hypothetical protein